MSDSPQPTCGNCRQRPAIGAVSGVPLCVDCYRTLQAAERDRIEGQTRVADDFARMINFLGDQIDATVGIRGISPRIQVREPAPILQAGAVTQNINIKDSQIGVVNTGTIHHLDNTIGAMRAGGVSDLADALAEFVEAAANAEELDETSKQDLLEGIDLILTEVGKPEERQRRGILRTVLERVRMVAGTVTTVSVAWQHLEPLLRGIAPWLF